MITQKLRLKHGWSQQELAEVSGLSLRTIQRIEAGATPSLESLKSLAAVFEVSIEDLRGAVQMTDAENKASADEELAMKRVRRLRGFYIHLAIYLVVCTSVLVALLFLSPDHWWVGLLLWFVWGAGLCINAVSVFFLGGVWERRQVERMLGRRL